MLPCDAWHRRRIDRGISTAHFQQRLAKAAFTLRHSHHEVLLSLSFSGPFSLCYSSKQTIPNSDGEQIWPIQAPASRCPLLLHLFLHLHLLVCYHTNKKTKVTGNVETGWKTICYCWTQDCRRRGWESGRRTHPTRKYKAAHMIQKAWGTQYPPIH